MPVAADEIDALAEKYGGVDLDKTVQETAQKHGVDPDLVHAVIKTESARNPNATSPVGAQGLMQLMPATAKAMGVTDAYDPRQNIEGGVKLLKRLQDKYKDNRKALAAYNAGEGAVDRAGGVPDIPETKNYVNKILGPEKPEDPIDTMARKYGAEEYKDPSEIDADAIAHKHGALEYQDVDVDALAKKYGGEPYAPPTMSDYGPVPGVPSPKVPGLNAPIGTSNRALAARPPLSEEEYLKRVAGQGPSPDFGIGDTIRGVAGAAAGVHSLATGKDVSGAPYPRVRGAAEAVEGTLEAATPAFAAGAAAAPVIAARSVVTALLAQKGTQSALKAAGVSEDTARLAADIAGVAAAGWTVKDLVDAARKVAEPFQPGQRFGKPLEGEVIPPGKPVAPTARISSQKPPIDIRPATPPAPEAPVPPDQPLPAETAAASAPPVSPQAVVPGAVFETPGGKFTVKTAADGKISYDKETPGGQVISGKLPEKVFRAMVARALPQNQPAPPTAPPIAPAVESNIGQPAAPAPAAAPEAQPITPEVAANLPDTNLTPKGGHVEPGGAPTEIPTDVMRPGTEAPPQNVSAEVAANADAAATARAERGPTNYTPAPLAPSTQVLERVTNKEDGTEAVIAKIPDGYSVALRDTDADKATGVARIFPTIEQARDYANTVNPPARKFSSTQMNLPEHLATALLEFGKSIPEDKLAADGRETEPHVTLKFGLHPAEPSGAIEALKGETPATVHFGNLSVFKTPEADVLKVDVSSPDLHRMNAKVAEGVEHTDTHPQYVPHATVAYLKPGEGAQYEGKPLPGVTGKSVTMNSVVFSPHTGEKSEIPLQSSSGFSEGQAPAPAEAETPKFQHGDRVAWTDRRGKPLSGTITSIDRHAGEAHIDTDQIMHAGGVPIGRIETVNLDRLKPHVKSALGPLVIKPIFGGKEEVIPDSELSATAPAEMPRTVKLMDAVAEKLQAGESLGDNVDFQKMARNAFGDVTVTPRDKYDALEAGVNQYLTKNADKYWNAEGSTGIKALHEDVEDKLPTQTHRTEEQIKEQQFSTPPSLALLAGKLLNPTSSDTVLEPSAGTGNLAIWPRAAGAKVITNELAPRRSGILKLQGFPVTNLDARYLHDLLPADVKPTAVLMNPPFSSDPRSGKHDTSVGIDHVEEALKALQPGGRLVAILGTKQGDPEAPKLTDRWQKIAKKYDIRASIEIDGEAYRKYGTTFGNSVVVIDNTGATPGATWKEKAQNIQRGHYKTPEEAWDGVQNISKDRSSLSQGTGETRPEGSLGANRPGGGAVQPGRPGRVGTGSEPGERGAAAGGNRVPEESRPQGSPENLPRNEPTTRLAENIEPQPEPTGESSLADIRGVTAERERTEEQGGSFVSYAPQRLPDKWGAVKHQANIVETASMAAIDPPPITEKPKVDWDLVKKGDISEVQLEAIAYAIQAHQQFLPSGERVGFFVGDGTGVGKGREIAGTIQHYWNSGTRRIIWVSYSTDLKEDAERDLRDIKANIPVKLINDFKRGSDITMGDGVIFLTYQSLASGAVGKDATGAVGPKAFLRLDQLKKWAGEEPVIIFDEAHKAKNSTEEKGNRGRQKASDSGLATVGLQAQIPKGKVVYSSATGATDVRNLGYASRLGLWGVGSSFDTFDDFRNAIGSGGVGAMEVVARDMKAQGRYLSRFISFDGVEYREVTHDLTPPQVELYNTAAKAWQTVFQNFNKAIEVTDGGGRARAAALSAFWGANQRFFRQFVTSMKMPTLLKQIEQARAEGKSVVISLMGTGAAQAERELSRIKEEEGSLDDLDFSAADTLIKLIEKSFPTVKYVDSVDDNGNPTKVMLMDADGRPVESKEALAMKDELLSRLQGLRFPEHPIDQIISKFGHEKVAELTGRKNQFLTDEKTGKKEVHRRKKEGVPLDKTNISEARDFQQGKKHIAIISAAASTGISLHADKRAQNQERRVHIVLETKWSADTQMQDFGRTHRTNQALPPEYVLMSSNVGGEKRFLSTIARRLSQLGALTRGQRDAASSGDLAKYNFESEYGSAATQSALESMAHDGEHKLGFEGDQALVDMGLIKELPDARTASFASVDVPNFLNRTLSLEPGRQNKVFDLFLHNFERAIASAKANGTFDEGVEDIKSPSIKLAEPAQVVKRQEATGAKTYYYNLSEAYRPVRRSFEAAQANDAPLGFYKNAISGNVYAVGPTLSVETDSATGATHERVRLSDVHGGSRLARKAELAEKYQPINAHDAQAWWDGEYSKIPALAHRPLHIIGGSIMPVWNVLQSGGRGLKTVRLKTDDGQYIVGARIANDAISRVLRGLGFNSNIKLSPEDVQHIVMNQGEVLDLAGDLKLRKVKLSGEDRMEVLNVPYTQEKTVQSLGVSKEFIQHRPRFFVNTHEEDALPNLLKKYPVVGSATGANLSPRSIESSTALIPHVEGREQRFEHDKPTAYHAKALRVEPITLDEPDRPLAEALAINQSGMEFVGRSSRRLRDSAGPNIVGMHFSPQSTKRLATSMEIIAQADFGKDIPPNVGKLIETARGAARDGKSLVLITDNPDWKDSAQQTLEEEMSHAVQAKLNGSAEAHMEPQTAVFLREPLAQLAANKLGEIYPAAGPLEMATEIGVRLMGGRWQELGLDKAQARSLAAKYLTTLKGIYGNDTRELAGRVFAALSRTDTGRLGEPGPLREGVPGEGRRGTTGGTGQDVSRDEGEDRGQESRIAGGGIPNGQRAEGSLLRRRGSRDIEAAQPEEGEGGSGNNGPLARPGGKKVNSGERGAAPMLTDLAEWVAEHIVDDGPEVNYSGLGSHQTKLIRNLSQIEKASAPIHTAAIRAASSRGQAATILRAAVPLIQDALKGSDVTWKELRLAMIESRLQGIRQRWTDFANQAAAMSDEEIEKGFTDQFGTLLDAIKGKKDIPQDVAQTAAALHEVQDWQTLRDFLHSTFMDAAHGVATVMEPEWYDSVTANRAAQKALRIYKKLVERPMGENHALNEGIFSNALGPLDTYYPLISTDRQQKFGPGRRLPYRKPGNQANRFATGLSEDYDTDMAAFRDRLAGAVRANDKAALIGVIQREGWLSPVKRGTPMLEKFDGPDGREYVPEVVETAPARTILTQGKVVHVPASMSVMPQFMARELRPILERQYPLTATTADKIIQALNSLALTGPTDAVFHSANLMGTLIANTPFLGNSPGWKAASLPILKKFTAMVKLIQTDPKTEEAARDMVEMAKMGLIPDRFGSVEYSSKAAEELGAETKKFGFGPLLFGRNGLDIRARLIMYRLAKEINPEATPQELFHFVNQLGTYVPALQGEIERAMKRSGLSPFYTAGSTMLRNGVNAWLGTGPMPKKGIEMRLWQQLTGGAIITLAVWALIHKQMTGKYPWEDKRSKLMYMPVPDHFRHSELGNALWGKGSTPGYVSLGFFNPLVMRGARVMGIPGAYETHQLRGSNGQMVEAAQRDFLNAMTQPAMGPVPRALFVGLTGDEAYLTGLRDREGRLAPQFFPAIPPRTPAPALGRRAAAAVGELNAFYKNVGVATGMLPEGRDIKANQWLKMVTDLAAPGLVAQPTNQNAKAEFLQSQRAGMRK